jgi:hypothetical protein
MNNDETKMFSLPNGHTIKYMPTPKVSGNAYILEIRDGDILLNRICSCNGVSIPCPENTSLYCDCTTNPPTLSCV